MYGPRAWRESVEGVYTSTSLLDLPCADRFGLRCTTHRRILRPSLGLIAGCCNPSVACRRGVGLAKISGVDARSAGSGLIVRLGGGQLLPDRPIRERSIGSVGRGASFRLVR